MYGSLPTAVEQSAALDRRDLVDGLAEDRAERRARMADLGCPPSPVSCCSCGHDRRWHVHAGGVLGGCWAAFCDCCLWEPTS